MPTINTLAVLALLGLLLAGCGFHLRGKAELPPAMAVTYIRNPEGAPPSPLAGELRQVLAINGIQVTADPAQATATLAILGESLGRRTLAVDSSGNAREYELSYSASYSITRADGTVLIPPSTLTVVRDLVYEEARVLGKAEGENLMIRNMVTDVAWSIIRRLQTVG